MLWRAIARLTSRSARSIRRRPTIHMTKAPTSCSATRVPTFKTVRTISFTSVCMRSHPRSVQDAVSPFRWALSRRRAYDLANEVLLAGLAFGHGRRGVGEEGAELIVVHAVERLALLLPLGWEHERDVGLHVRIRLRHLAAPRAEGRRL